MSQSQFKAPERHGFDIISYVLHVTEDINSFESSTYQEAISYYETKEWKMAMNKDMKFLQRNQTWDLVELLKGIRVVG